MSPLRWMAQAWIRFETTAWADALGAAALFATLAAGLFLLWLSRRAPVLQAAPAVREGAK